MAGNTRNIPELADLRTKMQRMEAAIDRITTDTRDLQYRVSLLSNSSNEYIRVRHRFLDSFGRQGNALSGTDSDSPGEYPEPAPVNYNIGDASTDAGLYLSDLRTDEDHFIEIYGMTPRQISRLGKSFHSLV